MKQTGIFIAALFLLSACETELDVSSVGLSTRLVVNAVLNDKDAVKVYVSRTTGFFDSIKPAALTTADVVIYDAGGAPVAACSFNPATEYYESSFVPLSGNTYTLKVNATGYHEATAKLTIPPPASKSQATWKDSTSVDSFGFPQGTLNVTVNDDGSAQNYYRITIYYYDDLLAEWFALNPALINAEIENRAIKTKDGGIIFTDAGFNGKDKVIGFITPFAYSQQTPKFLVLTENLSEDYYLYFKSLDNYRTGGGAFSEPSPIYTNIGNGVGIAAGSSIQRDTIY